MTPQNIVRVRVTLLSWIITAVSFNFNESLFHVSSIFKDNLRTPSHPESGFLVNSQHILSPTLAKFPILVYLSRHPLEARFILCTHLQNSEGALTHFFKSTRRRRSGMLPPVHLITVKVIGKLDNFGKRIFRRLRFYLDI